MLREYWTLKRLTVVSIADVIRCCHPVRARRRPA